MFAWHVYTNNMFAWGNFCEGGKNKILRFNYLSALLSLYSESKCDSDFETVNQETSSEMHFLLYSSFFSAYFIGSRVQFC